MDDRQHPLERSEPTGVVFPDPIPVYILEAIQKIEFPCLIYNLPRFRISVKEIIDAFKQYYFPLKCNAFQPLIKAALEQGAGLDICSPGELEIALKNSISGNRISYTGVGLESDFMKRLISIGSIVNLDSFQEVSRWIKNFPKHPIGLRLKADTNKRYLNKFGVSDSEIPEILRKIKYAGSRLVSLHAHFSHNARTAIELAEEYKPLLNKIITYMQDSIPEIEYLNLGGSWPVFYEISNKIDPLEFSKKINEEILVPLKNFGFKGRIIVEPGEFVVSDCGYWAAKVVILKKGIEAQKVAILNTTTPIPSAMLPYPVAIFRKKQGKLHEVIEERTENYTLVGITNSPFDTIRKSVLLPKLKTGDLIILCRTGAYLGSLMGSFNNRPAPKQYAIDENGTIYFNSIK